MEILEQRVEVLASQAVYATTIRTNYLPAEIIAIRPDGTSESTNPGNSLSAAMAIAKHMADEVNRLESELKSANGDISGFRLRDQRLRAEALEAQEARERFKRQRDAAYGDNQALIAERDQLKRELGEMHSAIAEPAAREAVQRVLHGVRPDLYESPGPIGGTIRPDDVVTFGKPPCSQCWCSEENVKLHVERNKIAGRLSKCREEKRAIAANYNSLVGTFDQIKRALGNCNSSDIVPIITGLQSTIAKLHIAESGRFTDERNALVSELSQARAELQRRAKCMEDCGLALGMDKDSAQYSGYVEKRALHVMSELQRLKTTYSMDRVHGMTLEEVRGMKYQLAANRETLDAAHAELRAANSGWNSADRQVQLLKDKLDAVTRALEG